MILFDSIELNMTLRDSTKASYVLMIYLRNPISLIKLLHFLCSKKGISISFGPDKIYIFCGPSCITDTYLQIFVHKKKIMFR